MVAKPLGGGSIHFVGDGRNWKISIFWNLKKMCLLNVKQWSYETVPMAFEQMAF